MQEEVIISNNIGTKKYKRHNLLGTGGFAKCFEVENMETHARLACKIIPKKNISEVKQRYKLMLEIKIHKYLKNKHIVNFEDVFEDNENIYIVMEHCRYQTLKNLVKRRKRLTQDQIRFYSLQIVDAIIFIQSKDIIHRDLKLGNILIAQGMQLKLCDFGLSTKLREKGERKKTVCGTPNYIAPEILDSLGHGMEVDIWSLGVIMFTMLTGKPPFQDESVQSTYFNIRNIQYSFPNIPMSDQIKDLIQSILVLDPNQRLTASQIRQHPFFQPLDEIPSSLPMYTTAIPPMADQLNHPTMKITPIDIQSLHQQTILNKSIIVKDSSHNYDSEYLEQLQFSLRKKSNVSQQIQGYLLFVSHCAASGKSIGYILNNGQIGCFFLEDQTCIIQQYDDKYFNYFDQINKQKPLITQYNTGILDPSVEKKYQKMTNYASLFKITHNNQDLQKMRKFYKNKSQQLVYVKKAALVGDNILIRLSNGVVELSFPDQTVVLVKSINENEIFYFKNYQKSYKFSYDINNILNLEIRKKVNVFVKIINDLKARNARSMKTD